MVWSGNGVTYTISIHALREEGDIRNAGQLALDGISIHALREEGDFDLVIGNTPFQLFLSTPSARRATVLPQKAGA